MGAEQLAGLEDEVGPGLRPDREDVGPARDVAEPLAAQQAVPAVDGRGQPFRWNGRAPIGKGARIATGLAADREVC